MQAASAEAPFSSPEYLFEVKWDGLRCMLFRDPEGKVHIQDRGLNDLTAYLPEVTAAASRVPNGSVIDGELVATDSDGRPDYTRLRERLAGGAARKDEIPVAYLAFDALYLEDKPLLPQPLARRRAPPRPSSDYDEAGAMGAARARGQRALLGVVARWHPALSHLQRPSAGGAPGRSRAASAEGRHFGPRQAGIARLRPDPISFLVENLDAVTGAFSFTGKFIARRLLADGRRVRTLTNHPRRPGAEGIDVEVTPLDFRNRGALIERLSGVDVPYNTSWNRLPNSGLDFGDAVDNTQTLMGAAVEAGVRKVVHISVSNPSLDSQLD